MTRSPVGPPLSEHAAPAKHPALIRSSEHWLRLSVTIETRHDSKVEAARAARAQWKKKVEEATEAGTPPPSMPATAIEPGKFVAPRLYVSDGTIERFGELLQARPQGVLRLTAELSAMFMNMSRDSGGQENEFWLGAWDRHSSKVGRIGPAP